MKSDAFDDKLRDRLGELPEGPTGHLWQAVESALPPRRPLMNRIGWTVAGSLVLALALWQTGRIATDSRDFSPSNPEQAAEAVAPAQQNQPAAEKQVPQTPVADNVQQNLEELVFHPTSDALQRTADAIPSGTPTPAVKPVTMQASVPEGEADAVRPEVTVAVQPEENADDNQRLMRPSLRNVPLLRSQSVGLKAGNTVAPWPYGGPGPACAANQQPGRMRSRTEWFAEGWMGGFYPFRQTVGERSHGATPDSGFSSVSGALSAHAAVMAGLYLTPGLTLKSGLQYTSWHERFRYRNPADEQTITIITIRTVILPGGDTLHIRDTSTQTVIGSRRLETTNRHQLLEIPVIVGLELGEQARLHLSAGVIATLSSQFTGYVADSTGRPFEITKGNNTGRYERRMDWGIYTGLGLRQPIGERSWLIVEPHARLQFGRAATATGWTPQRWVAAGIQAGWRYQF